ncbi:transcription-repair coupling factor [bacterium]|nr:MAG: transcription-repair coupling factor [bacterium]
MIDNIRDKIYCSELFAKIDFSKKHYIYITGISGSLISFLTDYVYIKNGKKVIFISYETEKLAKIKGDLDLISGCPAVSIYSSEKNTEGEEFTRTLNNLVTGNDFIILLRAADLDKKIISKSKYSESLLKLKKNEEYLFDELTQQLNEYNYRKKDFVEEVGDYSVRGGIIDLFPEHSDAPLRLEFFGETIESIREFDITTQRSIRELEEVTIGINLAEADEDDAGYGEKILATSTIRDYIPEGTAIIVDEKEILSDADIKHFKEKYNCIFNSAFRPSSEEVDYVVDFNSTVQPDVHSNIKDLYRNISASINQGNQAYIQSSDEHQSSRIKNLIEDFEEDLLIEDETLLKASDKIIYSAESLQEGFVYPGAGILVYTEHQVFGRYFRQVKKRRKKFRGLTFDEIKELKKGDYVVHRDFGVGIFSGLKRIKVGTSEQEVVKLSYAGGDIIFLNLNYVNLINKYSASEGNPPKLTRLGGGEWDKVKDRAKKKVKDIARDLILLYAKRKSERGFAFSVDSHWQRELEAGFIYEDTPDQITSTEDVKQDMQSETPMDRLVCGDVGFGKTEVAVRAAFKAVLDNKQVAVLVPTTILAVQHYNTFRDRLSAFAVEVECISRIQTVKQQKEILARVAEGKVNILIGTHRLLSKDIEFKDLGMLVIDEEQRFGVKAKEKLRAIKPNVDTLTLTATPIPRTLNFSLLGARDLSIINTPPKNRKPIITEIINFDWNAIAGVIKKELERNGQVYFVNDKISNLYDLADKLKQYIPYAKIGIAHGQMSAGELEDVIVDFIEKKLNVLFCTKIIESGLDIPNVNTIVINNANMYGLSELYQLRGRVGRSDVQAYAYLISPPAGRLTQTAVRRLQAIEEYTELGSGFNLSMRDMEIRGVGNLLGKEQSGFVHQMGFELFIDIIEEAVAELKDTEFKELFKEETSLKRLNDKIRKKAESVSTIIENDFNAYISEEYIQNDVERLNVYKRLYEVKDTEALELISDELRDRFGPFREGIENLLKVIGIKIIATEIGLEKISISGKEMMMYFPQDKTHSIFQGSFFGELINRMSSIKGDKFNITNNKNRLIIELRLEKVDDGERISEIKQTLNIM